MKNINLSKEVVPSETELKDLIINYVGNEIDPETDEITVEDIVNVFAEQFPEFLLALAEENWINGYTQALKDTEYTNNEQRLHSKETDNQQSI